MHQIDLLQRAATHKHSFSSSPAMPVLQMEYRAKSKSSNYKHSYVLLLGHHSLNLALYFFQLQDRLQLSSIDAFKKSQISITKAEISTYNSTNKKRKRDTSDVLLHRLEDVVVQPGDKLLSVTFKQSFTDNNAFVCTKVYQRFLREALSSISIPVNTRK